MFSPYYAWARRHGKGDPTHHCALNIALYGAGGKRWAMTERGRSALQSGRAALAIGPSTLEWDGAALTARIDEIAMPIPSRIRGMVRLYPTTLAARTFVLDAASRHRWQPIAPCARAEVEWQRPRLHWSGNGYLDSNVGDEPLEQGFHGWTWSRASLNTGTAVLYDVVRRDGGRLSLGLRFDGEGRIDGFEPPPTARLPRTLVWRMGRSARADFGHSPRVLQTLEDTPFYARSVVAASLLGEPVAAVHESLSLDRFQSPWVQILLPFRMPRQSSGWRLPPR